MTHTSGGPGEASNASAPAEPRALPVAGGNPNYTQACNHPNTFMSGCMHCCDACNYARHWCLGCGDDVPHGQYACPECDEEDKGKE